MADNLLKARIQVDAPGVQQVFNGVAKGVAQTEAALQRFSTRTATANTALIDLSRVVQDAPYSVLSGNISAIANNIDPLVQSFNRARVAAGSTGGALKAMAAGLKGPGGIGLAISIVTSALVLFGDKLFGSKKEANALKEALDNLVSKFADQAVQLTSLVGIVQNVNTKYGDKQKALKAINQEYDQYLNSIGIENVTMANLAGSYERVVDAMLRQAVVKGLQEEISQAVEKTAKKIIAYQLELERARQAEKKRAATTDLTDDEKRIKQFQQLSKDLQIYNRTTVDGALANQQLNNEQVRVLGTADEYASIIAGLKKQLFESLKPALNLVSNIDELGIKLDKVKKAAKIKPDKLIRFPVELDITFPPGDHILTPSEADRVTQGIQKAIIDGISGTIPGTLLADRMNLDIAKRFSEEFAKIKQVMPDIDFNLAPVTNEDNLARVLKQFQDLQANLVTTADIIVGTLAPAFQSLFDAISSNKNGLEAFFKSLIQAVNQLISRLVAAAIQAAILSLLTGGSAKGGKSFLDAFKGILGFRAQGGPVIGGGSYIVGENGPELFTPNTGGNIIPNNAMANFGRINAGGGGGVLTAKVLGKDLLFVLTQAGKSNSVLS